MKNRTFSLDRNLKLGYISYMKIATISQTKNNLSAYLDAVKKGETILIMDRDNPIARIEPIHKIKDFNLKSILPKLEREGIIQRPKKEPGKIKRNEIPIPMKKVNISEILIKEREQGR